MDTHVYRVSRRLGIATAKTADVVEKDLMAVIPEGRWSRATKLLGTHGRRICTAKKPDCEHCPVNKLCDYYAEQQSPQSYSFSFSSSAVARRRATERHHLDTDRHR